MVFGSMANDDGNFILSEEEYKLVTRQYPELSEYLKLFLGSEEYLHNTKRYCLWLKEAPPQIITHQFVRPRVEAVKAKRLSSNREATRKLGLFPYLFGEDRQPDTDYLMVPRVSSERRRYVPIGYLPKEVIASDACQMIPNANLYMFGVLTSNVHMAWMRAVCGRLEMRYRYSAKIVYNNFPWPDPSDKQKRKIEETAKMILDARNKHKDSPLADLYDEIAMPVDLRRAHQENDKAVMEAYGFNWRTMTESECVSELMKMYQAIIDSNT